MCHTLTDPEVDLVFVYSEWSSINAGVLMNHIQTGCSAFGIITNSETSGSHDCPIFILFSL